MKDLFRIKTDELVLFSRETYTKTEMGENRDQSFTTLKLSLFAISNALQFLKLSLFAINNNCFLAYRNLK